MADKKKKKAGGKKKKKTGENVYEALLEYKISVIDKELEEWRFRVHKLEEENEELMGRDSHLREECESTMKNLVVAAMQFDKENITYPKVGKEEVHAALHEKMNAAAEQEAELRKIHDEMFSVEVEIFKTRSRIKQWIKYRDVTRHDERRAIEALERELAYMIDNYAVLSKHLEKTNQEERLALSQIAQEKIEQKTRAATERVAMGLDRFTRKMLSENQYMNHEIEMREQESQQLEEYIRSLEQSNLNITERLNEAHVTNNTAYTAAFITEFAGDDVPMDLASNSLLAVDLGQLTIRSDKSDQTFAELLNGLEQYSPRLPAIEDEESLVPSMTKLKIEGMHMRIKSPPLLNKEEQECLDFRGPSWIETTTLKAALGKR